MQKTGPLWMALLLWLPLFLQLRHVWNSNPQYAFGWAVPFVMIYIGFKRLPAPPPRIPARSSRLFALCLFFAAVLCIPGLWFVGQANPDWRLVAWLHGIAAVAATLALLHTAGGPGWVRTFLFPVAFVLLAIPWPSAFEQAVTNKLMQSVAAVTVDALNLFGSPAVQRGNIIETAAGLIGIDEACSGVRSLQATLMASVFIGELFRLSILKRLALAAMGVGTTLLFNVVRTFLLSRTAATDGLSALEKWHDPAGWGIFVLSFLTLTLIARLLGGRLADPPRSGEQTSINPGLLPPRLLIVAGVVLFGGFIFTEIWYRTKERPENILWTVVWPEDSKEIPIPEVSQEMLGHDNGGLHSWWAADGREILLSFLQWNPGPGSRQVLAKLHRPEVCLPAAGWVLEKDGRKSDAEVNGIVLPLRRFQFRAWGEPWVVFQCFWENTDKADRNATPGSDRMDRLRAAIQGRRNTGHQTLQLAFPHYGTEEEATAAAVEELRRVVKPAGGF